MNKTSHLLACVLPTTFAFGCASPGSEGPSDLDTTSQATQGTTGAGDSNVGDSSVGDPGSGPTSGADSSSTAMDTESGGSESGSTGEPVDPEPWTGEHVNSKPDAPELAPFAISVSGSGDDGLVALKTDRHGNTYFAVNSSSPTLIVDGQMFPDFASSPNVEFALVKLGPTGAVEWVRVGDNQNDAYLSGISIDADDDIVVAGFSIADVITFDGQTVDVPSSFGFVAKLSPDGDIRWLSESPVASVQDVETAASGEIYVTGAALTAASIAMMSPDGAPMWREDFSAEGGSALGLQLEFGKEGLYWTGRHNADIITIGESSIWNLYGDFKNLGTWTDDVVALFDRDGGAIWARRVGSETFDGIRSLETAAGGGCLISGDYEGDLVEPVNAFELSDFGGGYLALFDGEGEVAWVTNPQDYAAGEATFSPLIAEDLAGHFHVPFSFYGGDLDAFGQAFSWDVLTTVGMVEVTPDFELVSSLQSSSPMFNGHHGVSEVVVSRGGQATVGGTFETASFQLGEWELVNAPSQFKVFPADAWVVRLPVAP